MLLGATSAVVQALAFPEKDTSFVPLLVLWVVTSGFYYAGSALLLISSAVRLIAVFYGISTITAIILFGFFISHVLNERLSIIEYASLGAYLFFLIVLMLLATQEFS